MAKAPNKIRRRAPVQQASDPLVLREQGKRLAQARAAAGYKNPRQAAEAMGIPYQTYHAHETGNRSFAHIADRYAKKFSVSLDWLLNGEGRPPKTSGIVGVKTISSEFEGVPLVGKIHAGHWFDVTLLQQDGDLPVLPIMRDDRFPHARQYALEVVGDSMDELYPDGSYVTVVDFAESGLHLKAGHVAHVERQRAGGQLVENTLKAVEFVDGVLTLVPKSKNKLHKAFPLNGIFEDTEIFVRGVVLWGNRKQEL